MQAAANNNQDPHLTTFDALKHKEASVEVQGASEEVLQLAYAQNAGYTMANDDLIGAGTYIIPGGSFKGEMQVLFVKKSKGHGTFVVQVMDYVMKEFKLRHDTLKAQFKEWSTVKFGDYRGPEVNVPLWIKYSITLNHNIIPEHDTDEFLKIVAREYPDLWIYEPTRPKR